jgi:hypothetical protein
LPLAHFSRDVSPRGQALLKPSPSLVESATATSVRIADMSRLNMIKDMTLAHCGTWPPSRRFASSIEALIA